MTTFIRCGNRQAHGMDKVSHSSVADVKACFEKAYFDATVRSLNINDNRGACTIPGDQEHDHSMCVDMAVEYIVRPAASRREVQVGDDVSFRLFGYLCNGTVETAYPDGWLRIDVVGENTVNIHSGYVTVI